jgi:hypothetical protein
VAALVAEQVELMAQRGCPVRDLDAFQADWRRRIEAQARPGFLRAAAERLGLPHVAELRAAAYSAAAEERRQQARRLGLRWCSGGDRCDAWTPPAGSACGWCGRPYQQEDR